MTDKDTKAKTGKMPIYRDRKPKSGKLSNATMEHLDALRTRKPGNGPVEPTIPPYVFHLLTMFGCSTQGP